MLVDHYFGMQDEENFLEKALKKVNRQHTQGRPEQGCVGYSLGYIEVGSTLLKSIYIHIDR